MALLETSLRHPKRRGKVRDVYDLGDRLLLVATDRISAYDWVLPTGIPDKGRVLTALSRFWFDSLGVPNHLIADDDSIFSALDLSGPVVADFRGRSMLVRKAEVVPFECVVRGYLAGSGWREYRESGSIQGEPLPAGLVECSELPEPMFTPATKAESGHDQNIPYAVMADAVGPELADRLRAMSLDAYVRAAEIARSRGLILADTKFEFGLVDDPDDPSKRVPIFIDEVLTPDSSRYWPAEGYEPGRSQPSFDKQYLRDWLDASGWDKASPPPRLPDEVVEQTRARYLSAFEALAGRPLVEA